LVRSHYLYVHTKTAAKTVAIISEVGIKRRDLGYSRQVRFTPHA
jgi:hypothetical protein